MVSIDEVAGIILDAVRESVPARSNYRSVLSLAPKREGRWGFHAGKPFNASYTSMPAKRIFLSEYDIKKLLKPNEKKIHVPKAAIISPLAQEWLETHRIEIRLT